MYKIIKVVCVFFYNLSMRERKKYLNFFFFFFVHIIHLNESVLVYFTYLQELLSYNSGQIWQKNRINNAI